MATIMRCAKINRIIGMVDIEKSGSFKLVFNDGSFATLQSGKVKHLINCFNSKNGKGGLQEKIHGLRVIYCMNFEGELQGLTVADEWKGPEMEEGDFLVNHWDCQEWR